MDWRLQWVRSVLARRGAGGARIEPLLPTLEPDTYRVTVASPDAIAHWHALREVVEHTGLWPVVLGTPADWDWWRQTLEAEARAGRAWAATPAAQSVEAACDEAHNQGCPASVLRLTLARYWRMPSLGNPCASR